MKESKIPKFRRCVIQNFPFIEEDFDALTDYGLICKIVEYLNKVIDSQNEVVEETDGLIESFAQLKSYVDDYFDNLDVQEEINTKLEEMAESGELENIIAQFLSVAPVFGYKTISDMASATNLINGSIARVLGNNSAAAGDGAFYLVREKAEGETADGVIKVAIGDSLIADRIVDGNLNSAVSDINSAIDEVNEEIDKINSRKTHNIKFVGNDEPYYAEHELRSDYNGLGFEGLVATYGTAAEIGLQGVALWKRTGQLVYNNETQIYTLTQTNDPTQNVLWTGNYGHGGDSCILADDLYIADSENTAIYKVDLNTGNKTTYAIPAASIKNETQNYTPVLSGVCADEQGLLYIVACDPENNDHTIKSGSTVRIYTFNTNTNDIVKIFEMSQDTCYIQGMTKDEEFFYLVGNKPFTSGYAGNIMTIIKAETMTLYDKLSNNSDYEHEGLDYGAYDGMEGLISVCAKFSVRYLVGMYSFYGNQTKLRILFNNAEMLVTATRSRDGFASVYFRIVGTFGEGDNTYSYDNIFKNAFPIRTGSGALDFCPIPLTGSSRNFNAIGIWDYNDATVRNRLRILEREGSAASTKVEGHFTYLTM